MGEGIMKTVFALLVLLMVAISWSADEIVPSSTNLSLWTVARRYTEWTGKKMEIVQGVYATITFPSNVTLSVEQAVQHVETELTKQNVGVFPIATNRVVVTWIDPSKAKPESVSMSFAERMRFRREALRQHVVEQPTLTGKDLQKHLREVNLEYIRKGMPPQPIHLTPEEDAKLVEEGILPPQPPQKVTILRVEPVDTPTPVSNSVPAQ
jgi:hypothetical protein